MYIEKRWMIYIKYEGIKCYLTESNVWRKGVSNENFFFSSVEVFKAMACRSYCSSLKALEETWVTNSLLKINGLLLLKNWGSSFKH